ncbi:hypothetical protein [Undibacterium terreum]|uniref:Uncharacterized protein n=1 Tax=Undibacterium terreum TaxID=1224302 RepID=A0A916XJH4_9BURK|nr:hypothetical protein [Undibacterium terreum]GGC76653.1 hypothetical protein GCM10011396_24850 [Undibacterium terreum]
MTEDHIKRLQSDPDGLDFDGLRRKGIDLLQALSRGQWTDYNLHDPGVTLLELLCYGLTDLVYRTDFDVADFLAGPEGDIAFRQQALFPPQDIFPNQPVTDIDFCKLIYDKLASVDDVWINSSQRKGMANGLFSVYIKPRRSLFHAGELSDEELRKKVISLLSEHRNLCRDVDQVYVVRSEPYTLGGDIEIDDSRPAAEIYADIYFRCAKLISSGGQVTRFEEALAQGMSWESMLEGPLTYHGYIKDNHFAQSNYEIDSIRLITLVRHIRGVKQVKKLFLIDTQGNAIEQIRLAQSGDVCPVLAFPSTPAATQSLRLMHGKSAGQLPVGAQDEDPQMPNRHTVQFREQVALYLRKLEFEHDAFRNNEGNLERLIKLPQGQYRTLGEYSSIGEHTPDIYGINHYGVPKSDPPEVHARARQLKAYLYPFEQMMANYLASLQGLKELYSISDTLDKTYFAQFLRDSEVPNLEILYQENATPGEVDAVLHEQDTFTDRRNRVLDSLLAMYGEVFPADRMRRYDVYHTEDVDKHLIRCKIRLLHHLCQLSADRGNAMNVQAAYWTGDNYAAIQHRVQLLSGASEGAVGRSLIAGLGEGKLEFISNARYKKRLEQLADYPQEVRYEQTMALVRSVAVPGAMTDVPHGVVCPSLMLAGIHRENYRVLPVGEKQGWLCLNVDDEHCWPIMLLPTDELAGAAQQLQNKLIALSQTCEGFHLLEHVLLRPRGNKVSRTISEDFYAHRISVILPVFTARFTDPGCRAWMELLIVQNLPAHVLPEFYWLDFALLAQFELRYRNWLELLSGLSGPSVGAGEAAEQTDIAADQLIEFLRKSSQQHSHRYWL